MRVLDCTEPGKIARVIITVADPIACIDNANTYLSQESQDTQPSGRNQWSFLADVDQLAKFRAHLAVDGFGEAWWMEHVSGEGGLNIFGQRTPDLVLDDDPTSRGVSPEPDNDKRSAKEVMAPAEAKAKLDRRALRREPSDVIRDKARGGKA